MMVRLGEKHRQSIDIYNCRMVNDITFNRPNILTTYFKDYLVYDEISEFLKRYYRVSESTPKLSRLFDFYNQYYKVFPNYILLRERQFMYKNIERKQRHIDE